MGTINSTYTMVCLEHNNAVLYTEVIQAIAARQRYWVRPILLCEFLNPVASKVIVQPTKDIGSGSEPLDKHKGSAYEDRSHFIATGAVKQTDEYLIYDVRSCSDLLCPSHWFRSVFDTELIPLLSYLSPEPIPTAPFSDQRTDSQRLANQKLYAFIQNLWDGSNAIPRSLGGI